MIDVVRSELTRISRKGLLLSWFGLTAVLCAMVVSVVVSTAGSGAAVPRNGPGVSFATVAQLEAADGFAAALGSTTTMVGVLTLACWAVATASDYSSGLVRLLVQAQPRRARLVIGKAGALAIVTVAVSVVAVVVTLIVMPPAGAAAGISLDAWRTGIGGTIVGAWLNTLLALWAWGIIGLVLAVVGRSATVAIGIGIGYVLLLETVLRQAVDDASRWLPGSVLGAVGQGGTAEMSYGTAIGLAGIYAAIGLAVAVGVFTRRDVTD